MANEFQPHQMLSVESHQEKKPTTAPVQMMDVALADVKHHPYLGVELSDGLT